MILQILYMIYFLIHGQIIMTSSFVTILINTIMIQDESHLKMLEFSRNSAKNLFLTKIVEFRLNNLMLIFCLTLPESTISPLYFSTFR